jgi:hypothetical protein
MKIWENRPTRLYGSNSKPMTQQSQGKSTYEFLRQWTMHDTLIALPLLLGLVYISACIISIARGMDVPVFVLEEMVDFSIGAITEASNQVFDTLDAAKAAAVGSSRQLVGRVRVTPVTRRMRWTGTNTCGGLPYANPLYDVLNFALQPLRHFVGGGALLLDEGRRRTPTSTSSSCMSNQAFLLAGG